MSGRVIVESYRGIVAVTPDDDTVIAPTRAFYVGVSGDVAVEMADGSTGLFKAAPVGTHEYSVTKILATGTTATDILAVY